MFSATLLTWFHGTAQRILGLSLKILGQTGQALHLVIRFVAKALFWLMGIGDARTGRPSERASVAAVYDRRARAKDFRFRVDGHGPPLQPRPLCSIPRAALASDRCRLRG
jgi:hypothetical protein